MAQLIVRNLDEALVRQLKRNAAEHGRSAEEEHREILRRVLGKQKTSIPDFKTLLVSIPGGDDAFERPRDTGRPIDL